MLRPLMDALLLAAERGHLPDSAIRLGVRLGASHRLRTQAAHWDARGNDLENWIEESSRRELAESVREANEQHYEVPARFFELVLGPNLKYSSCLWEPKDTLGDAEKRALDATVETAQLLDGQNILELGCGWGSLTLHMARRFPQARIMAVSNSAPQRRFILDRAHQEGLGNVDVVTADINHFAPEARFDRVVSVEMFEHVRNHQALFDRIATWVQPEARLFVHVFRHRQFAYLFETSGSGNWMGRHFFTGGVMPSSELMPAAARAWQLEAREDWDGSHYQRTANAWLDNLDARRAEVEEALRPLYGAETELWIQRWRIFFMACADLFGFRGGSEWGVTHYRFSVKA